MPVYGTLLIIYALMSVLSLAGYGIDKYKAKIGAWRTRETTLLGLGLCGGAVGALLGMQLFRHKTKHWYFWVINVVGLAVQVGVLMYFVLL